jgi:hypothetical protein
MRGSSYFKENLKEKIDCNIQKQNTEQLTPKKLLEDFG